MGVVTVTVIVTAAITMTATFGNDVMVNVSNRRSKRSRKCPVLPTGPCGDALAYCRQPARTAAVRTC